MIDYEMLGMLYAAFASETVRAPAFERRALSDLEGFLVEDSPADDVTLIVVKVI